MKITQQSSLFCQEGSADKEYHIQLVEADNGFLVNFQHGRRGSTMKPGTKTPAPVDKEAAEKIFTKLLKSKLSGGYQSKDAPTTAGTIAPVAPEMSTLRLQHLVDASEEEALKFLSNDDYLMQEKMDGERRAVQKTTEAITGINKKNQTVALQPEVSDSILSNGEFDGESIGDTLYLFTILALEGKDLRKQSEENRLQILEQVKFGSNVKIIPTAYTTAEKKALYKAVKDRNGEGVVFKLKKSAYTAGRASSGGPVFKYKFYKTATFIVANHTPGKRSVGLEVMDGKKKVNVGKVTIPANKPIPALGSFVEVRYLYAFPGGAIFQSIYLNERNDVDESDAGINRLVYKQGTVEDDE